MIYEYLHFLVQRKREEILYKSKHKYNISFFTIFPRNSFIYKNTKKQQKTSTFNAPKLFSIQHSNFDFVKNVGPVQSNINYNLRNVLTVSF